MASDIIVLENINISTLHDLEDKFLVFLCQREGELVGRLPDSLYTIDLLENDRVQLRRLTSFTESNFVERQLMPIENPAEISNRPRPFTFADPAGGSYGAGPGQNHIPKESGAGGDANTRSTPSNAPETEAQTEPSPEENAA